MRVVVFCKAGGGPPATVAAEPAPGHDPDGLLVELERLSKHWRAAVAAEVERAERIHEAMQQALLEVQAEVEHG